MSEPLHLYRGRTNDDGTVTVTSFITVCCSRVLSNGRGTVIEGQATCGTTEGAPHE